jgi:acetyl esterase/lipase
MNRAAGIFSRLTIGLFIGALNLSASAFAAAVDDVTVLPDVVFGHKIGMALTFDVYQPSDANGAAIIFANSGGFVSGQLRQCEPDGLSGCSYLSADQLYVGDDKTPIPLLHQFSFGYLLDAGFTVFDLRHGGGPKFTLDEIVADVDMGIGFIVKNAAAWNVDSGRIGIWGASAGGYLAVYISSLLGERNTKNPVSAVAVYYPAGFDWLVDLAEFPFLNEALPQLQIDADVMDRLSIRRYIGAHNPPTLIIYGDQDQPFITGPSQQIHQALKDADVVSKLMVFAGTGHEFNNGESGYDRHYGEQAQEALVAWFTTHLRAE